MKKKNRRLLKIITATVLAGLGLIILFAGLFYLLVLSGVFGHLPAKADLSEISGEEASLVFSSDSVLIGKFFAENRTNVDWEDIPDHLKEALLETEDKRFYTHNGYDTRSYFRVFLRTILLGDKSGGGGSTITQQLVKNLYGRKEYRFLSLAINKMKEILIATRLEDVYTKDELLLLYLNSVPFGEDLFGVESASQRYFSKHVSELKPEESAVLVGMLKANTLFNPQLNPENSLERRNLVLTLMKQDGYLEDEEADSLCKLPLKIEYRNLNRDSHAGYFVYQVQGRAQDILDSVKMSNGNEYNLKKDGLRIYTTLDTKVQEIGMEAVKKHIGVMQQLLDREFENMGFKKQWYKERTKITSEDENDTLRRKIQLFDWENGVHVRKISRIDSLWHYYRMLNASVLIINPKNGAVITWIGGNNYRLLPFDMVLSHRQIASAFKPVLYATAIEKGISPCEYLENEENIYEGYEDWEPQNADLISTPDSSVALWYSLTHSINLPTVDLYFQVGRKDLVRNCERLGFPVIEEDAPSIALGALDLSLYEIVRAYSSFANSGLMNEPFMITKITDVNSKILYTRGHHQPDTIFTPETSQLTTAILQQVIEQGTGSGMRSNYGIKTELAGKTGTAQNYSNAWFIAYTPEIVLGTWV
ncbi:MAG TPA: peptidoglycan glycosyltransferase, partial [Bacteroidales bacterium]|nr:peptidoglycan glycosyltransferase [Bacteroidales bacterium]